MNLPLIDALEHEDRKLRAAIAGLTPPQLRAFPVPGTWSIHQIVIHVSDSALVGADRMKRIIAMENPPLLAYDETLFSKSLHYHEQPLEEALDLMRLSNSQMARLLRLLPEEALARKGIHSEAGEITLKQMIERMVNHVDHHLKFIHEKRKMIEQNK